MSTSEPPSLRISPVEDDKRPYVKASQKPKFGVGDEVYLTKNGIDKGPYLIASVCSGNKFTLSLEDGANVENGDKIDAEKLKAA